mgnify:CR=1 FL=1
MYPTKPLWKICEILLWWTPPRNDKKNFWWDFLWCSIRDMKTKYISDTNEKLTNLWVKNSNVKLLKEWTLFMSFKLSLWKLAFAWKDLYTNEAIAWLPIKNENELDKEFLYYILSWYNFTASWTDNSVKWATLNKAKLEILPIPLPPLPTQKLIVQKLDSAFENIDKNINLTKENLKNLEELNKSVLEKVFIEWEYEMKKLWEIFDVRDWTHDSPKFFKEWFPLVTSKNLIDNSIDLTNVKLVSENDYVNINKRSKVDKWDLLFAMIWTIWNPTIVNFEPNFAIKNVALFKKKSEIMLIEFLKYYLLSDLVIKKMLNEANWATQKFVWLWYLRNFQIPLPPLQKQKEIVSYLDEVFAKNKELKTKYELQLKQLEELKQSLLKDAFEWRLV